MRTTDTCGAGNGTPFQRISPYITMLMPGINRKVGTYQRLAVMRRKSSDRRSSAVTPSAFLSRWTINNAASVGQNAASTPTDNPGINCTSSEALSRQNGADRPSTKAKNASGDLCVPIGIGFHRRASTSHLGGTPR